MVHVLTKKGKGYKPAEESPNKFHGTGPFDIATGKKITNPNAPVSYTEVFGKTLTKLADIDDKIVGITAAMPDGTGFLPRRIRIISLMLVLPSSMRLLRLQAWLLPE